jgi:hypothetical protein
MSMPSPDPSCAVPADDPPPRRPEEPDPADCCGEGCVPCVYDRYDEALQRYREALAAWRKRHPGVDPDA